MTTTPNAAIHVLVAILDDEIANVTALECAMTAELVRLEFLRDGLLAAVSDEPDMTDHWGV